MIDFTKYTLQELQAVVEVLDWLTDDMAHMSDAMEMPLAFAYYGAARTRETMLVSQHVREAERKLEALQAEPASEQAVPAAADPPAPPDMFGWVGDALDDLCAAGEVLDA